MPITLPIRRATYKCRTVAAQQTSEGVQTQQTEQNDALRSVTVPTIREPDLQRTPEWVSKYQDNPALSGSPLPTQEHGSGVDVKGCDVDVKGYNVDVKGSDVDVKGSDVDVKGSDVDVKGSDVDVKGSDVDIKGSDVDVKGYAVDVKGYDADVKDYAVDVKGYDVDGNGRQLRARRQRGDPPGPDGERGAAWPPRRTLRAQRCAASFKCVGCVFASAAWNIIQVVLKTS
eukprot:1179158-Prorocentrum_minimum.AAC.1